MLTILIGIVIPTHASAATITVPTDSGSIQAAIDSAAAGDTIFVKSGTYYEHLTINKPITLQGEDKNTTIIDGSGSGNVIYTNGFNNLVISDITVKNGNIGIYLERSTNNFVKNVIVANNIEYGISLGDQGSSYNTLQNIEAYSNRVGIIGYAGSNSLKILDSNLHNNSYSGAVIGWSYYWTIENTRGYSNERGITIDTSSYGTIKNCEFYNNDVGINAGGVSWGEHYNTIVGNKIHSNRLGIDIWSSFRDNTIKENQIYDNKEGIVFQYIKDYLNYANTVYHNDLNNDVNAKVYGNDPQNTGNIWDNGYPDGGNFYSDYAGVDQFSGSDQNEEGSDSIGDVGYTIAENNIDRYPLMKPWHSDFPYGNQPPATNQPPVAKE
ncbi:NosD domain-containing protein [Methanosarcina sp. DH1]|uniref:right-handed parallel beta-helix repeat-containing protein n=1 Tax=Methanosarcina sp. DH1 TaxID=2605695 RepID=UPI001E32242C|nr:NosD domain-containing protein [Methanosarcina sp. DH1]